MHTSHSNPNTVNRYMPAETRLAKKEKLERDRAALGRAIDAQPFALLGVGEDALPRRRGVARRRACHVRPPAVDRSSRRATQPTLPDSPDGRGGLTAPLCANQGGSAREVGAQWLNREAGTPGSKSNVGSQKSASPTPAAPSAENVAACAAAADALPALAALAPLSPPGADPPPMPDDGEAPTAARGRRRHRHVGRGAGAAVGGRGDGGGDAATDRVDQHVRSARPSRRTSWEPGRPLLSDGLSARRDDEGGWGGDGARDTNEGRGGGAAWHRN